MGTGKSTVGHAVASLLHFQMIDTDVLIEQQAGRTIAQIFQQDGEARFRQYEKDTVAALERYERTVFATGGGLGADAGNLAALKAHALVACLWASPEAIWRRVRRQSHRPLLHDPDPMAKIRRLLAAREPTYRQADVLVNTELRSAREVALQVAHQFQLAQRTRETSSATPGA